MTELQDDLMTAMRDLALWTRPYVGRFTLIGGLAAVFLGRPRVTRDIDAVFWIEDEEIAPLLESGAAFGYLPRLPDALEFALENRVLLMRHASTSIEADLALGLLPFEQQAVVAATPRDFGGFSLPLPTAEDLVIMKAIAGRPRDIGDIEGIVANTPNLDNARIRLIVGELAAELGEAQIMEDLDRLLK